MHTIHTVDSDDTTVTRECSCGWVTIGTIPEPTHHTPLAEREATHLAEVAKIENGSVWFEIPAIHSYRLHLRRRALDQTPNTVVITAVWMGGSREAITWPWDADGLATAQWWINQQRYNRDHRYQRQTVWSHSGFPVGDDELAVHADAR
jgi:hypothetical protein